MLLCYPQVCKSFYGRVGGCVYICFVIGFALQRIFMMAVVIKREAGA